MEASRSRRRKPLATRRTIEAEVLENGLPRARIVVARYRLRAPALPGRVTGASAKRTSAGLSITWHKASRASRYRVTVTAGAQTVASVASTSTSLLVPSAPAGPLTVRIVPLDATGRAGPATTVAVA